MVMMIVDGVFLGLVVIILEADIREIVFGCLLSTDLIETTKLGGPVAMGIGSTVVTIKREFDGSSLASKYFRHVKEAWYLVLSVVCAFIYCSTVKV